MNVAYVRHVKVPKIDMPGNVNGATISPLLV